MNQREENINAGEIDLQSHARDLCVHALLVTRNELPIMGERRMQRLAQCLHQQHTTGFAWGRFARTGGGLLAVAALLIAAFVSGPQQVNAADRARAIATQERASSDRRVMFLLTPPGKDSDRPLLSGTLDVRDAKHIVLMLRMPHGAEEIRGRNGDTSWSIDPRGVVHTEPCDRPWPVWIQSPRGGLIVDMAEMLETGLQPGWQWSRNLESNLDPGTELLQATRAQGAPVEPNKISVMIDSLSGKVKRMEISWAEKHMPIIGADGQMRRGGERGWREDGMPPPRGGVIPMGAPGSIVIVPEPAITFTADWFTAEHYAKKIIP